MIKKFFISIGVLFSFFFLFLFGSDKINILAMGNFNNSIGTIPIQIDIANYDNINLISDDDIIYNTNEDIMPYNTLVSISNFTFEKDKTYTIKLFGIESSDYRFYLNEIFNGVVKDENTFFTYGVPYIIIEMTDDLSFVNTDSLIKIYSGSISYPFKLMIVQGSLVPDYYSSFFKFGYIVNLSYLIRTTSNTIVDYYFNDYLYTKTTSVIESGYLIENYYLPFNIDSKGYVSLSNVNFGISSISNNSNTNTYSLYLELTPVFSAYYKGELTSNIYTKLNYMSNDLFFSGITFSGCNENNCYNSINSGNLSLSNPKILAVTEVNDTGSISITNISTYYNDDIKNRNYFYYYDYLNIGFRVGDLAESYTRMNGVNYTFGISSLSSRIVDNQTTTTPLPNNPNTTDKYNTCSAWYDIPCQLGNAVTFVIYEAPIISPVLTFIVSFITMFSSLVSFVDLFQSFGVLFGCFLLYMFIELLHKYSK